MLKLPKILTYEEVLKKFEKITNIRDITLFKFIFYCGLRVSEVLKITPEDIDLKEGVLTIRQSKRKKDRLVPIPNPLVMHLKTLNIYVSSMLPFNITPQRVWQLSKKYFGVKTHALRHSYATYVLEKTGNLEAVKDLLGHSDIRTTSIYTHLTTQDKKKIIDKVF